MSNDTTTISVTVKTYARLVKLKERPGSFDKVIQMLLDFWEEHEDE